MYRYRRKRRRTYSRRPNNKRIKAAINTRLKNLIGMTRAAGLNIPPSGDGRYNQWIGPSMRELKDNLKWGNPHEKANALTWLKNRRRFKYWGDGDYKDYLGWIPRGIYAGANIAKAIPKGRQAIERAAVRGWDKGGQISKIMGMGDYDDEISSNQIVEDTPHNNPQQNMHHAVVPDDNLSGDMCYSNSEFIGNIYATCPAGVQTSPFQIRKFELNPGLIETFPFFSQLAQNFELYTPLGMLFQYKPTSGEFGNNTSNSLGKVIMATNYDPDANDFPNAVVMENYDYANSTKPSQGAIHGVECAEGQRSTNSLYVRTGISAKQKIFTDIGNFYLATEGIPFGSSETEQTALVGELWVTYSFKLSRSKLYQAIGDSIAYNYAFYDTASTNLQTTSLESSKSGTLDVSYTTVDSNTFRIVFNNQIQIPTRFIWTVVLTRDASVAQNFAIGDISQGEILVSYVTTGTVATTQSVHTGEVEMISDNTSNSPYIELIVANPSSSAEFNMRVWIQKVDPDFTVPAIALP
jgi:hypothetical protein